MCIRDRRVLDQPPWEALFSFILSANNNVLRIRSLVYALSRAYGPEADGLYGIPGPEALAGATEEALRALGVGYRAPYLIETARAVCDGFPLDELRDMPYEEAVSYTHLDVYKRQIPRAWTRTTSSARGARRALRR